MAACSVADFIVSTCWAEVVCCGERTERNDKLEALEERRQ